MAETKEYGNILGGDAQLTAINRENFAYEQQLLAAQYNQTFGMTKVMPDLTLATSVIYSAWSAAYAPFYASQIVEIVSAAGAPSVPFVLCWTVISQVVGPATHELRFYQGESGAEVAVGDVVMSTNAALPLDSAPMSSTVIPARTRVSVAASSAAATGGSGRIRLVYREYSAAPVAP